MNLHGAVCVSVCVLVCVSLSAAARILPGSTLDCSQEGLNCTVSSSNCMDSDWLYSNKYTPSKPEELQVSVEHRYDAAGRLQPVLVANWKLQDDGGISHLKATELHVLVMSTNQNLCVRYSFKDELPMRNGADEKWSFSADMVVVDPGQSYRVSVFNIPKPELGHSSYDVYKNITVPDCQDRSMQRTQYCINGGSLWQPNISLAQIPDPSGGSALSVSFRPDPLCEEYIVIVKCSTIQRVDRTYKANETTLNVSFSLDKWPKYCCQFDAEIKPLFPQCGQDCTRRKRTHNICDGPTVKPTDATHVPVYQFVVPAVVLLCVLVAVTVCVICRKPGKPGAGPAHVEGGEPSQQQLKQAPKVLVIYSQDHHLYKDIVLKLCAFLQTKCGTKVLVDLLDTTSVGMVGRLRWLEWQRQQLKNPSDKILVLCSRGVQAKWRAMCGHGQVTLREDVLSPTDDILTPFLNLFLPDMHQAGMHGRYMVAYFDDISSDQDVPSVFDIAVKYKLMKHFEELYFRILDIEKYQPGQVKHIEGISGDEYFNCPSGTALKNAIESFQAYQVENPDWFERECVECEEEAMTDANVLIDQLQIPPVLECAPLIRHGPPVCIHEVEINENGNGVHVLTPELNTRLERSSVAELTPLVNPVSIHRYPSHLDKELTDQMYPCSPSPPSIYTAEPVLNKPPQPRQSWPSFNQVPTEDEEEDSLLPMSQLSVHSDQRSSILQHSLHSVPSESSHASMYSEYFPSSEVNHSQPVEMEEYEIQEPSGKGQSSGSDQGYISKMSSQHEPPLKEDPMVALRRLQEALFQRNLSYYDIDDEGN